MAIRFEKRSQGPDYTEIHCTCQAAGKRGIFGALVEWELEATWLCGLTSWLRKCSNPIKLYLLSTLKQPSWSKCSTEKIHKKTSYIERHNSTHIDFTTVLIWQSRLSSGSTLNPRFVIFGLIFWAKEPRSTGGSQWHPQKPSLLSFCC